MKRLLLSFALVVMGAMVVVPLQSQKVTMQVMSPCGACSATLPNPLAREAHILSIHTTKSVTGTRTCHYQSCGFKAKSKEMKEHIKQAHGRAPVSTSRLN